MQHVQNLETEAHHSQLFVEQISCIQEGGNTHLNMYYALADFLRKQWVAIGY